jgi:hypothetical protein
VTDGYVTLHHPDLDLDPIEVLPGQVVAFESVGWQAAGAEPAIDQQQTKQQTTATPPTTRRKSSKE